jgi:hypothetical protein
MKIRLALLCLSIITVTNCILMTFKTVESAVDQNLSNAAGIDIIKFLNLDSQNRLLNTSDVEEAEILKHKSKLNFY